MSLSQRLRAETRDAHDRIEAAFDLEASLASRERYGLLLQRLLAFHDRFEREAAPHLRATPLARFLVRAGQLRADLGVLGLPEGPPVAALGLLRLPDALGAAYVVEGSTLGGVLIAREAERRLGIGAGEGGSFFAGHGRETAATWRGFTAALDGYEDPATDGLVVAAADRTYAAMQACLLGRDGR